MVYKTYSVSLDSRGKAVCKTGKPCGDICIPKTHKCDPESTREKSRAAILKTPGFVAPSVAVATAFIGIAAADSHYKISDKVVTSAVQDVYAKSNSVDFDKQIEQLPISDEFKNNAKNLIGTSKVFLAKEILNKSGSKLLSVDEKHNLSTFQRKDGSLISVGSYGSTVITFGSDKARTLPRDIPLFEMGFKVNEDYSRSENTSTDRKKGIALIRMAQASFDEHIKYLPENCILRCRAHKEDGLGAKRQSIYEKKGFSSLPVKGDYIWASKNLGKFEAIPENGKSYIASLVDGSYKKDSAEITNKNDSFTYHLSKLDAIKKAVCKTRKQCGDRLFRADTVKKALFRRK